MTRNELLAAYAEGKRDFGDAYLGGADLHGADLHGADLHGADLHGAYLGGANLGGADLHGAYLGGADLHGAYLGGAYLGGADLHGANLGEQWIIQGPARSDGYFFFLMNLKGSKGPRVVAGCRDFTVEEAKAHWQSTRGDTQLGKESLAIVDHMVALANTRKLSFEPVS